MSSQHKLYNYEVAPPAEAWERIAQELEGVNDYRSVSQKLQSLQVAAPAFAWERISGELDEQQSFDIFAKKLSAAAVIPPAGFWNRIEEELDNEMPVRSKPAPVIPLKRRLSKYAAAAAVLGILALSAYLMVQRSSEDARQIDRAFASTTPALPIPDQPAIKSATQNKIKAANPANNIDSVRPALALATPSQTGAVVTTSNGNAYTTTVEKNREASGRYIVLMTEEGNVVRMNKKVSGLADCIAGEDASQECNNQIETWQKELASMPVLASPDNILGLLELAAKEPTAGL